MNKSIPWITTLAALLPLSASALDLNQARPNEFNYNYAEIRYVDMDAGQDGLEILGSFDVKPNLSLNASLLNTNGNRFDYRTMSFGAAYHAKWVDFERSDLIIHLDIVQADVSRGADDTGLMFGAKARIQVQEKVEAVGDISYTTLYDDDLMLTLGAAYTLTPELDAVANYQFSDNDTLNIGLRYNF